MAAKPWYRATLRWGQTNLVEIDPGRYDADFWRAHWRRTRVQGLIVNAGGIVAYYPSAFPLHHRAIALKDRDLYGEVVAAAREEGLRVIARMDSNRVAADFRDAHPDWICVDERGEPYRQADKYITCINSPYYSDYLPGVMREIIGRSHPDGFSDNSWPGLPRNRICHCQHCRQAFAAETDAPLPTSHDWDSDVYRRWIRWSFRRRTELWDFNNAVTTQAGGPDCIWSGMISGDILSNNNRFIDLKAILPRARIVMLDHQHRSVADGFAGNTEAGKRLHEMAGWEKLIPESMPQYLFGPPAFRLASMPVAEVRLWSSSGFAGGIQPWWHHIGAAHEDRRQYATAEPIFRWHEANSDILVERRPEADVGVLWSQTNHNVHGQGNAAERTAGPYRGAVKAIDRAGLTYLPVEADDIETATGRFDVLFAPNLAAMSDGQVRALEAFVAAGGSVIATSETSAFDEDGAPRADFALGSLFGIHRGKGAQGGQGPIDLNIEISARHTYLRLSPEIRAGVYGPADATVAGPGGARHPVLAGFEMADTLPFGGYLPMVGVERDVQVLATFIPDFPIYPPETSFMREPRTDIPAIAVRETASGARLVWFVADIDRCFARDENVEHAMLIANAVRWALKRPPRVVLEGARGFVTPSVYRQGDRQIVHLNNRLTTAVVPGRQNELVPLGPVTVRVSAPSGRHGPGIVRLRVADRDVRAEMEGEALVFTLDEILDHEVVVFDWI